MNILAAVDFSAVTQDVLNALRPVCGALPAKLWLVHVAPPEPDFVGYEPGPHAVRNQVAAEHRSRHQQLQSLADAMRAEGIETTALLLQGPTVETLIGEAAKLQAALIVLGSHGHGRVYDLLVGSVAEGIVRRSKIPVLLVPAVR
jgi:nucleotide-binding universal stress UspA family protein